MKPFVLSFLLAAALYAGDQTVAQDLNQFGADCYRQLASGGGNLIFSPFSISSALSMTLAGARGETAGEMTRVLHQAGPDLASLRSLVDPLVTRANRGGNQLLNANALWVQAGFHIEPDFQGTLQSDFQASLTPLDFARQPEGARVAINAWTDEHTNGKIRELFARGSLPASTRLILSSAVYFYGKWEHPFQSRQTLPAAFKLTNGSSVQATFMHQTGRFGYTETPSLQILEMNYAGTGLALDILLPKPGNELSATEGALTGEALTGWLRGLQPRTVEIAIPKFRAESEFSLREALSRMGMATAFTGAADFSGMDGRHDLTLADVRHKAFVEVSEQGTEAAAATGTAVALVRMIVPDHPVFRADHPFLFLIRDTQSGLILFGGRLVNPKL